MTIIFHILAALLAATIFAVVGAIVLYLFALALYFRRDKVDDECGNCDYYDTCFYHCRLDYKLGIVNPGSSACEYFRGEK